MNKYISLSLFIGLFFSFGVVSASAGTNPTGNLDSLTCSSASGWSYDPGLQGCTNPSAKNYNPSATQDDGSCIVSKGSSWITAGIDGNMSHTDACAQVGAVPSNISGQTCASGEGRPTTGNGWDSIQYKQGTWGGDGDGGTDSFTSQVVDRCDRSQQCTYFTTAYECYTPNQKRDHDSTDVTQAYYCDFGATQVPAGPQTATALPSNSVQVYVDGTLVDTIPANVSRPDVNAVMGVTGNHGFNWNVPASLYDNTPHSVAFYGTDIDGNGVATELSGSPQTITCDRTQNIAPITPTLSCPANGSFTNTPLTISFSSTDPENQDIQYLIDWNNDGINDQFIPSGSFVPSGTSQSVSRSWFSAGSKTVNVSARDTLGRVSVKSSCSFSLIDNVIDENQTCQDVSANNYAGTLPCTYPDGITGGDGSGGTGSGSVTSGGSCPAGQISIGSRCVTPGFTLSATPDTVKVRSIGGYSGSLEKPVQLYVNPVYFASPVSIEVSPISPELKAEFSFNGATFSVNPISPFTLNSGGLEYLTVQIRFSGKLPNGTFPVTFKATSESYVETATINLDSRPLAPGYTEF